MARSLATVAVFLERGSKRTFACAVDWPGWCRSGRDEASALQALIDAAPRYARVVARSRLGFVAPADLSALQVVARLRGNATTDFGAPGIPPAADARAVSESDMRRLRGIMTACWRAFDAAVTSARGKTLRKGPRGGGRELDGIVRHVLEADEGYIGALGWKHERRDRGALHPSLGETRRAMLDGIAASARGEIPAVGPRGGKRWKPRYAVRRSAWHVLDHAWEIEDRAADEEPPVPA